MSKQFLGFEVTQRVFIEQTLERLYHGIGTSIALKIQRMSGQLMPLYLHRLLGSLKRQSIVEVNCGYGFLSNYLSLFLPETSIVGIEADVRKTACAQGSIGYRQNLKFIANEFSKVPKIEADLIILRIKNWDNEAAVQIQRAYHWLIPGGDLVICADHPKTQWKKYLKIFSPSLITRWIKKDPWLDLDFLQQQGTPDCQSYIAQEGFACLAEYNGTGGKEDQQDLGLIERALAYVCANTWHHAEKPLFTSNRQGADKVSKFSISPSRNEKQISGTAKPARIQESRPQERQPDERQILASQQAEIRQKVQQMPAAPIGQYAGNFFKKPTLQDIKAQEREMVYALKDVGQQIQDEIPISGTYHDTGAEISREASEINDATNDALSYIFSKPWTCFSQEISTSKN